MYQVRRVHIGKTAQLDELAHACGELYSKTLVFFWRTVRHKGIWLKPKHLMRLFTHPKLHAHTSDACVQAFFAGLSSWRERRKTDASAHPPRRRRWYFRIEYKRSAMKRETGLLQLSNGRGNGNSGSKSRISNTSRPHSSFPRCITRACKPWSLAMFGIFGKTTMWAPPTTRKSISGPMAVSGTCLPTRQGDWE